MSFTALTTTITRPLLAAQARDGLTAEENQFADALIRDLGYLDTARRWLDGLESSRRSSPVLSADIDSRRIDILQAEGRRDEYDRALGEFKKKYPWHRRASIGSIELIGGKLGEAIAQLEKASAEPDAAKAKALRESAKASFRSEVEEAMDALIDGLDKAVESDESKVPQRNQSELTRVKILRIFGEALDRSDPDRQRLLEKGLKLADFFIDERFEFYIATYEAQLEKGLYLLALERNAAAAEALEILLEVEPLSRPPYDPAILKAFHSLRIKAAVFGSRARSAAGEPEAALALLRRNLFRPAQKPLDVSLDDAEKDPDLRQLAVLARLEFGAAQASSGDPRAGLEAIHQVIQTYESSQDPQAKAFVVDARKALGRVAASGGAQLSGYDYYQAGMGLKSELRFEEALGLFRLGLTKLGSRELGEVAPLILNEIGELCYILDRFDESAIAFEELLHYHRGGDPAVVRKAATSFLGAVTKAQGALGAAATSHQGYQELAAAAQKYQSELGDNSSALVQAAFNEAARLEIQRRWADARRVYERIEEKDRQGRLQPDYYRARASWIATHLREWQSAAEGPEKEALEAKVLAFVPELKDLLEKALPFADESAGASVAALTLGELLFHAELYEEGARTLELFTGPLAKDEYYRCSGLAYLILNGVRAKRGDEAGKWFADLLRSCPDDASVPAAAWELAEDASARGEDQRAGLYMLEFAKNPASQASLENIALLMRVITVLADANMVGDAGRYIDRAKLLPVEDAGDLERQLKFIEGKLRFVAEDWDAAVKVLNEYVEKFRVDGATPEDAQVTRLLGESILRRAQAAGKLSVAALREAEKYLGHTVRLLDVVVQRPDPPAPASVVRDLWVTAYRYMQVKCALGRKGDRDAYGFVHNFCNENMHRIRKTPYQKAFEKYWRQALEGIGEDPDKFIKKGEN